MKLSEKNVTNPHVKGVPSVVLDKNGDPVPQYPAKENKGNGSIDGYWMSFEKYCELPE